MERVPTESQFRALAVLGTPGTMLVSGIVGHKRLWRSLLKHGWVEAKDPGLDPENGLLITPHGLRALAAALEAYGLSKSADQVAEEWGGED